MSLRTLIDGAEGREIEVSDRGLQYGDGLFETLAIVAGRPRRLDLHLQRLREGCSRLGIPFPETRLLESEIDGLARGRQRTVLKLILTRGPGGRGYRPPAQPRPTRILQLNPWPDYPDDWRDTGVAVRLCRATLGDSPLLAGLKSLNRLEQVLARQEWHDAAIPEGLMLDARGAVVCGTMSNLFSVHDGVLRTPAVDRCGVAGTMRRAVLEAARLAGMQVEETVIKLAELARAEEVFLTNALIGIWPVRCFENSLYRVGPVTRRLQALLEV